MMREGVCFILMHNSYLRPSNIFRLRKYDIIRRLHLLHPAYPFSVLRIFNSKSGGYDFVEIRRSDVADVITRYADSFVNDHDILFPFSSSHLQSVLDYLSDLCGLSEHNFTLKTLRQGGATHDYLSGVDLDVIQRRGLWQSRKNMYIYLASGVCLNILTSLPPSILQISKALDHNILSCFSSNPFLSSSPPL
jgi:hypothetical protein